MNFSPKLRKSFSRKTIALACKAAFAYKLWDINREISHWNPINSNNSYVVLCIQIHAKQNECVFCSPTLHFTSLHDSLLLLLLLLFQARFYIYHRWNESGFWSLNVPTIHIAANANPCQWFILTMRANNIATKFVEIACNNRKNKLILWTQSTASFSYSSAALRNYRKNCNLCLILMIAFSNQKKHKRADTRNRMECIAVKMGAWMLDVCWVLKSFKFQFQFHSKSQWLLFQKCFRYNFHHWTSQADTQNEQKFCCCYEIADMQRSEKRPFSIKYLIICSTNAVLMIRDVFGSVFVRLLFANVKSQREWWGRERPKGRRVEEKTAGMGRELCVFVCDTWNFFIDNINHSLVHCWYAWHRYE